MTQRTYKHGDMLNLSDAAKLFAQRDMRSGDNLRTAEGRARAKIKYDAKNGKLPNDKDKGFLIEEFVGWAKSLTNMGDGWEAKFNGLPSVRRFFFNIDCPAPTLETSIVILPGTLEKANELIRQLQAKLDASEEENAKLRRADEARKAISKTNSNSAKRKRNL